MLRRCRRPISRRSSRVPPTGEKLSQRHSTPLQTRLGELPGVTVDSAGNVFVSSDAFDPVTGVALNYTQVTKITNGGTTLVQNVKAVNPAHWLFNSPQGGSFRAFTIPQIASDAQGVYLVWDDVRLGNANVYLTRSTDGGTTWSSPLRVNDLVSGQHFFPTLTASGGTVTLAWYDSRFSSPGTMTALDVFFAQSTDAGVTFSPSYRVTSVSFNPNIVKRTDPQTPTPSSWATTSVSHQVPELLSQYGPTTGMPATPLSQPTGALTRTFSLPH